MSLPSVSTARSSSGIGSLCVRASRRSAVPRAPGVPSRSLSSSCSCASRSASAVSPSVTSASTASSRQPAKTAWRDAELEGAGAGFPRVRQCVVRPVLREPQPGAALKQRQRRERAGRRIGLLSRGGQRGVRAVEVVCLHEGVDEERQRPQHRRRGCHAQLVLECEPGVRLGVADLACPHERHRPEHAAVGERDQPAARARDVDEGVAQRQGRCPARR